jgi:hypothetical protein
MINLAWSSRNENENSKIKLLRVIIYMHRQLCCGILVRALLYYSILSIYYQVKKCKIFWVQVSSGFHWLIHLFFLVRSYASCIVPKAVINLLENGEKGAPLYMFWETSNLFNLFFPSSNVLLGLWHQD